MTYSSGTVICSSLIKELYTPRGVFIHAASLRHPFGHCEIFLTAASRRSLGSVSVPVRRVMLSHPLPVVALVSRYLTNKLIGHKLLSKRLLLAFLSDTHVSEPHAGLAFFSKCCPPLRGRLPMCYSPVCHSLRRDRSTCMP